MRRAFTAALVLLATALPAGCAARPAQTARDTARDTAPGNAPPRAWTLNSLAAGLAGGYAVVAGLPPLRDTLLAPGDLEARLWRFNAGAEVYLLRRTAGRWSGLAVRPRAGRPAADAGRPVDAYESRPLADTAVARTWAALEAGGVLSLRDAPGRLPPGDGAALGESYAFEVRRGPEYQSEGFARVDVLPGREATAARALFAAAQALLEPRPR